MEDSSKDPSATGSPDTQDGLRNSLEEQQQILSRLSQELDDYFALRVLRRNK